jgi:hypothetical protein
MRGTKAVVLVSGHDRLVSSDAVPGTWDSISVNVDVGRAMPNRVPGERNRVPENTNDVPRSADDVSGHKNRVASSKNGNFANRNAHPPHRNVVSTHRNVVPRHNDGVPTRKDAIQGRRDDVPWSGTVVFQSRNSAPASSDHVPARRDLVPVSENRVFTSRDAIPGCPAVISSFRDDIPQSTNARKAHPNAIFVQTNARPVPRATNSVRLASISGYVFEIINVCAAGNDRDARLTSCRPAGSFKHPLGHGSERLDNVENQHWGRACGR